MQAFDTSIKPVPKSVQNINTQYIYLSIKFGRINISTFSLMRQRI